jgi:NAD kinase
MAHELEAKLVLVVRPTRLDELIARFNTVQQAQFYVEHSGADFTDYLAEHKRYQEAIVEAETELRRLGLVQRLDRRYLPNYVFGPKDTVVVLGQDGLVANTLKYLDGQRVIGVNPDPARWDGVLLPFDVTALSKLVPDELAGRRDAKRISIAQARLNNGQVLHGVNDIFVGPRSHISARYLIRLGDREERQSSSGIIISTGLGSTGWLKSVYAGWSATSRSFGFAPDQTNQNAAFAWDAPHLHFVVREPFPSRTTSTDIVIGKIGRETDFSVVSHMPEHGVIFSDGIEADFLEFNSGAEVSIGLAEKVGMLVV